MELKWRIHYLTSRKLQDWHYLNGIPSTNRPFFNHDDSKSQFLTYKPKYSDAWLATWYAAHHVYTGEAVSLLSSNERPYRPDLKVQDVHWMLFGEELPIGLEDLGTLRTDCLRYDYWENIPTEGDEKWLKTLQHHLNLGVYYSAGVMNNVIDGFVKCELGMEEELAQEIQIQIAEYAVICMMAAIGNLALVILFAQAGASSGIFKKLKILEALQITK